MKNTWDKGTIARSMLGRDQMKWMMAKQNNESYKPWKSRLVKTKDTPFGQIPKKTKPLKNRKRGRGNIFEDYASTQVCKYFKGWRELILNHFENWNFYNFFELEIVV